MPTRSVRNLLAVVTTLLVATPAGAVHWPQLGGDPGRSGYQPLGDGTPQVQPLWTAGDPGVVTSPVVTAGRLSNQRVAYGTADGRVHLRRLLTGERVGPPTGVAVEDALTAGVFGDGSGGSASFADTSTAAGLGAIMVVHNARNSSRPVLGGLDDDVEISVVDEGNGEIVQNVAVPGTTDHAVASSAVLSPPDEVGIRRLLFVAGAVSGSVSLFAAEVVADRVGQIQRVEVPGASPLASPGLAYLRGAGGVRLYALVATQRGLRSFAVTSLSSEGPSSSEPTGDLSTPAVPISAAGLVPGQAGSGAGVAPAVYVAASEGGRTRVVRVEQGADGRLAPTGSSEPLAGAASPSLTLAQEVVAGTAAAGWVVVTTQQDLFTLDARTLGLIGAASAAPGGPKAGFASTVAASAGRLAFASRADGTPEVIDLQTAEPVGAEAFVRHPGQAAANGAIGQPAISRGLVVFTSNAGVFAYRTRCGQALGGTAQADVITGAAAGDAIAGRDGADKLAGGEGDDCLNGGPGADALRGDAGADALDGARGDDRLNGGPGDDVLLGGDGRDRLSGSGGADRLAGGLGADTLSGGDQDDRILARGGGRDRILCGRGRDRVSADRTDRVSRDCERVTRR